ncbi:hypothetical protein BRC19_01020, partial [Candidatus Saccharibacteria bacterium QS_5_54_17]
MQFNERWSESEDHLTATVKFRDFTQAVDFLNRVAEKTEEHNYHSDVWICISNVVAVKAPRFSPQSFQLGFRQHELPLLERTVPTIPFPGTI